MIFLPCRVIHLALKFSINDPLSLVNLVKMRSWYEHFTISLFVEYITRVLLHFSEDVTHNLPFLALRDVRELGPRKALIGVVFYLVMLWNAEEVAVLHDLQVIWTSMADVHIDSV